MCRSRQLTTDFGIALRGRVPESGSRSRIRLGTGLGSCRLGRPTSGGAAGPAYDSALFFGMAAPNPMVLQGSQSKLKALTPHRTVGAHRFRQVRLIDGIAGEPRRKKEIRV